MRCFAAWELPRKGADELTWRLTARVSIFSFKEKKSLIIWQMRWCWRELTPIFPQEPLIVKHEQDLHMASSCDTQNLIESHFICLLLMLWRGGKEVPATFTSHLCLRVARAPINHVNMTRDNTQQRGLSAQTFVTSLFCCHKMFIICTHLYITQCPY